MLSPPFPNEDEDNFDETGTTTDSPLASSFTSFIVPTLLKEEEEEEEEEATALSKPFHLG